MSAGSPDMLNLRLFGGRRLPLLLQSETAECGLACLGMVAGYWGHRLDMAALRQRFPLSLKGIDLKTLTAMAGSLTLLSRPLKLDLGHVRQLQLPCILHWDMNHFVVLARLTRSHAEVHDPAVGVRRLPLTELSRHFTGVALELRPATHFKAQDETRRIPLRRLIGAVSGLRRGLLQLLLLGVILQVCALLLPFYLQWIVDEAVVAADRDLVTVLGVGALLLVMLQAAVSTTRSWAAASLAASLNFQWLGNVYAHLLQLPLAWFEKRRLGDVVSRFGAVQTMQRTLTTQFVEALIDGLLVIGSATLMFLYSPTLLAVALLAIALYGALRWLLWRRLRAATAEQIMHAARQQTQFLESVRGIQAIRLFNRAGERHGSWLNLLAEQFNAELRIARLGVTQQTANALLLGVERTLVIWLAALAVLDARFSVGMLFAFLSYKDQFSQRLAALIDRGCELAMLRLHASRLADIVLAETEDGEHTPAPAAARPGDDGALELRNVSFRYGSAEPWVLRGLNLRVPAGQCVAITGASGCGKTTLIKLLAGLHQPTEGEIWHGGIMLGAPGMVQYRDQLGTVMQDDQLFSGSIADNISFFDPEPQQQRILMATHMAAIHAEIAAMPMGYATQLGESGGGLSGGQRQRLLLARALYRRPRLLLLDEATSHLDPGSERLVNTAIRQIPLTRIIVAHRAETIAMAERVVVLEAGQVLRELTRRSDPVDEHEQPQPHHVDEVPIPGHGLEGEVSLRGEVPA